MKLLHRLCERYRPAVLLVTMMWTRPIKLADRIVVLESGKLRVRCSRRQLGTRRRRGHGLRNLRTDLLRQMGVETQDERRKEPAVH